MKKILALGFLSVSLASASVFVGIDGGYSMVGVAKSGKVDSSVWQGHYNDAWNVSANIGYEAFFNGYFGTRAFLSVGYGTYLDSFTSNYTINVDGNVDAMLNFINTGGFAAGIFAGVGVGYQYNSYLNSNISSNSIPLFGRAGITFGIGEHLRLDLTAKMPIVGWDLKDSIINNIVPTVHSPLVFQAGIKFLF